MHRTRTVKNGETLARNVQVPVRALLVDMFKVAEPVATTIEQSFQQAEVAMCNLGSLAMHGTAPKKVQRKLKSLQDAYTLPSGQVHIHSEMVEAIQEYLLRDSILGFTKDTSRQAASRAAAAFEIGRYLGYGIWHLSVEHRQATSDDTSDNSQEAEAFFDGVMQVFADRGIAEASEARTHDPGLISHYNNAILPERFFSRAGLMVVEQVSPVITGDKVMGRVGDHLLNRYLGEIITDTSAYQPAHEMPADIQIPPLEELGVIFPLSDVAFQKYWPTERIAAVTDLTSRFRQ